MRTGVFLAILMFGGLVTGYVERRWPSDLDWNPMLIMAPFILLALIVRAAMGPRKIWGPTEPPKSPPAEPGQERSSS